MNTHVALLRGINVGGNNTVPMKELRAAFETMGYSNVSTYINSGNVIFESEKAEFSKIEQTLKKVFGFSIETVVRSKENIQKIAKEVPKAWQNDKDQKTDVIFLWDGYDNKKSLEIIKTNPSVDTLCYIEKAIVWHIDRKHYNKSGMNKFIGTLLYKNMTARNINTVRKLAELMT